MDKKPSISVIIPALNEEGNIEMAVKAVAKALTGRTINYEIIIFDDASCDNTGKIADALAKQDTHVKVVHNSKNMGIGYNFLSGVKLAKFDYFALVPGDNEISAESVNNLFQNAGESDITMLYPINPRVRTFQRRFISKVFIILMNVLFFLRIRYYNGPCLVKTSLLRQLTLKSHSFAYMAIILVQLIKNNATFTEIGMVIQPRKYGHSKALGLKNAFSVLKDVWRLFMVMHLKMFAQSGNPLRGKI